MFRRKRKVDPSPDQQDGTIAEEKAAKDVETREGTRSVYLYPAAVKEIGGDKWGYIHSKGKWVLFSIYDHAGEFQDNELAIVHYMNLAGVIDLNGYFIVKPKYDTINPFSEGRATVIDCQGFKVIDESGKEITDRAYSFIGDYKQGRALMASTQNGRYLYGYLNKWGKEVIPLSFETAADFDAGKAVVKRKDGQFSLIGLTGKIIQEYSHPYVGEYGDGMLVFQSKQNGKFGYMNEAGTVVIKPQFSGAGAFHQGRAIVHVSNGSKGFYGLIDKSGRFIFKPNYSDLQDLGEGKVALGKAIDPEKPYIGSTYAIGDQNGHILTGFIFNHITKYENGFASVCDDHSTYFIDNNGKKVNHLPIVSGNGELRFDKSVIKGEIDYRLAYFDKKGKQIWEHNRIIELHGGMKIHEEKYKPNKDFLVYYPRLSGLGPKEGMINQTLKDLAGIKETPPHLQLESNYLGDYEVPFYKGNLLEIEITGYDYPFGAAHGMPVKKYAHIDLQTGAFYQLKDLFKPGSQYVKVISAIIGKQMISDQTYSYIFPGSYKGIQADQPFFVKSDSLSIYFAPYEIAPYASGFPTFTIPFDEMEDIIDKKGAFWRTFH
ncbi:WG repeat-containing protein [Bacillota bacterium Lsc_1132]